MNPEKAGGFDAKATRAVSAAQEGNTRIEDMPAGHLALLESCIKSLDAREGAVHVGAIRMKLGLSTAEFAAKIGVSTVTVGRWESGKFNPGTTALRRIRALVLGSAERCRRNGEAYSVNITARVSTSQGALTLLLFLTSQVETHETRATLVEAGLRCSP